MRKLMAHSGFIHRHLNQESQQKRSDRNMKTLKKKKKETNKKINIYWMNTRKEEDYVLGYGLYEFELTLMLLVATMASIKTIETWAHGYSSESIQRELSNEYQHDRV